jgi:2-keto-4-pentenoate hydratase
MTGVEKMVRALVGAHRGEAVRVGGDGGPSNVMDAYRVQEAVLRELSPGVRPTAWKVSPAREGADPLASPVPPSGVHRSPAAIPMDERIVLGVECEIAFRLGDTPRVDFAAPDDALESVAEAIVLLELCETRLADWSEASPLWRLADFQSHGAFVLGSGTRDFRSLDYARQEAQLRINGRVVVRGVGGHPTRDLHGMLAWAIRHCARRRMPLEAGDVITMGTWTGLTAVRTGEELAAVFPGVGEAKLRLQP